MTAFSRKYWSYCSCKVALRRAKMLDKIYPPSCTASYSSEGKKLKNIMIRGKDQVMALGERREIIPIKRLDKSSGIRQIVLPR